MAGRISAEQDYLQAQQSLRVAEIDLRNAQEKHGRWAAEVAQA